MRLRVVPRKVGEISGKTWEQAFVLLPRGEFVRRTLGGFLSPSQIFVYLASRFYLTFGQNEFIRDLDAQSANMSRRIWVKHETKELSYCSKYLNEKELAKI